jgi:hypothetical protein
VARDLRFWTSMSRHSAPPDRAEASKTPAFALQFGP